MTQTAPSDVSSSNVPRPRLGYVDNLRVALTVLVVVHHAAASYSNIPGAWYYAEPARDGLSGALLTGMLMVDQAFFMGAFFLLSGLFVPGSVERKGSRRFFSDRMLRLGVPLLVFLVLLRPLVNFGYYDAAREQVAAQEGVDLPYWLYYVFSWDPGPMWFVELLLIFSAAYLLWRRFGPSRQQAPSTNLESRAVDPGRGLGGTVIVGFAFGLTLLTYLWRIVVPIGTGVPILGLPTVAYLPQYAALFVVGLVAARRGWLQRIPAKAGWAGLAVAIVSAGGVVFVFQTFDNTFTGEGSWQSLLMASCESGVAVGFILALLVLFRERINRQGRFGRFLSEHAYTVYITHALVLVALGHALAGWAAPGVAKFALLAVLAVPLCWALASAVRALPGARKVL